MTEAILEPRKLLHIPEKIIDGMIDIVQSHKSKPSQVSQQSQVQTHHGYPQQYTSWNTAYPGYNQNQFQNQGQYVNYGSYPTTPGQIYPSQQGFTASQVQAQGQYQAFPQIQSGNQYQVQNQQSFIGHIQQTPLQAQFQGQSQQSGQVAVSQVPLQGHNQQPAQFGVNQGQIQGQNQQAGQFGFNHGHQQNQGQIQNGQLTGLNSQTGSLVNGNQSGQYGHVFGQNTQFPGQEHGGNGQTGGYQVSNSQPAGPGPTCVCQAWTKPQAKGTGGTGKSEGTTEIPE